MIRAVLERRTKFSVESPGHIIKVTGAENPDVLGAVCFLARAPAPAGEGVAVRAAGGEGVDSELSGAVSDLVTQ